MVIENQYSLAYCHAAPPSFYPEPFGTELMAEVLAEGFYYGETSRYDGPPFGLASTQSEAGPL